ELWSNTGAQRVYLLRYYNWNSFLLSEIITNITEKPLCSLWVKKANIYDIPPVTQYYFSQLCHEPKMIDYPDDCPKTNKCSISS
ncbi:hypothetical protein MTO96_047286, partial [Rhipicephalus appendiculatus]